MTRLRIPAILAATLVLALLPARASHKITGSYVALHGYPVLTIDQASLGIGGYSFSVAALNGHKPSFLKITDDSGVYGQAVYVCQNANGDQTCAPPDPGKSFCTSAAGNSLAGAQWVTTTSLAVYIYAPGDAAPWIGPTCTNLATKGTIQLTTV